METADPYRTAELRRRVLDAWADSPARFREDANAEEELARGAYRDRVIVELAQNAADAAALAGPTGRLLLRFDGAMLVAANTGAPLDRAGVEALSTLRASAKRDDVSGVVGRFGVGFAAVLAVTDVPSVVSRGGGVRWSRDEAAALVRELGLEAELAARGGALPVLRLPFPASGGVPDGFDTAVHLPMRDPTAGRLVAELLDEVDDALLLALPNLGEIVIERDGVTRRITSTVEDSTSAARTVVCTDSVDEAAGSRRTSTSWRLVSATGAVPAELLAERPTEERGGWTVTVAVPRADGGAPAPLPDGLRRVVHAPTPTEDPTALPVLVLAGWPLDSSRRHVQPGPLTDFLAARVADAYSTLVRDMAPAGSDVLRLVPGPMAAGVVDATLHRAILAELARTPFVPPAAPVSADDHGTRLRPDSATMIDDAAGAADPAALSVVVPNLADPQWWRWGALDRLGARRVPLVDVIDTLAGTAAEPRRWHDLYEALQGVDAADLATLPVPLTDGRTVRGPRGALLPVAGATPDTLEALDLRVVHPDAVHPLLRRLGAREAEPAAVLRDAAVREAVERLAGETSDQLDTRAAAQVADAVLDLAAASGVSTEEEPWLARLLLPDGTGTLAEAGELWMPGSAAVAWLDADPAECCVSDELVAQHGPEVLEAVGVQRGFSVARAADVPLDPGASDLPDYDVWVDVALAALGDPDGPPILVELAAVLDLDLVRDDAWPAVLNALASDEDSHAALTESVLAILVDGTRATVPSYTSWWIRTYARIDDHPVGELCAPNADAVVGALLRQSPAELSAAAASALGLASTLDDLIAMPDVLLNRLADPDVRLPVTELGQVYGALAAANPDVVGPDRIRAVSPSGDTHVSDAGSVVVITSPQWLQLSLPAVVPGPPELADVLGVDRAEQRHAAVPDTPGAPAPVPDVVGRVVPDAPRTYVEHEDLRVGGQPVSWWVDTSGAVHAATSDGLARALAWVTGQWDIRLLLAEILRDPGALDMLVAEHQFATRRDQL